MPTIYQYDNQQVFTGVTREISTKEGCPRGWTRFAPPNTTGTEVAYFQGSSGWVILPERPPLPPEPVPQSVSQRQARLALSRAGILASVQPALEAITDQQEREEALIEWEFSDTIERSSNLVVSMGGALGLDDEAIDNLFRTAATL